jgi:glutamate racemase
VEASPESPLAGRAGSPIGIFDSGLGGLSVLQEIRAALPAEDLLYVADSGHVPYGSKDADYILRRSVALTEFLLGEGAKAVVIACNTATAAAATHLRSRFPVPIVGMEPAVKPAAAATRAGVVGVLATVGMLENARFAALLERFGSGTRVVAQGCPGLVEQVEAGDVAGPRTRSLVRQYTQPLISSGADVIVLGCTHYAFLRPVIAEAAGAGVQLIETGAAVARQLRRVLEERSLLNARTGAGSQRYWTTGDAILARRVMSSLLGRPVVPCRLAE